MIITDYSRRYFISRPYLSDLHCPFCQRRLIALHIIPMWSNRGRKKISLSFCLCGYEVASPVTLDATEDDFNPEIYAKYGKIKIVI